MEKFCAKATALLIASRKLDSVKCPPGIFDAAFTREVNRELKDLPDQLRKSALRVEKNNYRKKYLADNPEIAQKYKRARTVAAYLSATRKFNTLLENETNA